MATPEEIAEEVFENTPEVEEEVKEEVEEEVEGEEGSEDEGGEGGEETEEREGEVGEEGEGGEGEDEMKVEEDERADSQEKQSAVDTINHVLEKINDGLININRLFELKKGEKGGVNGSISSMLEYQFEKDQNKEYLQYVEYLKAYYEKSSRKSVFQKGFEDGKIILSQKGQQIRITPSVVVDLYHYKELLEREIHTLLFKIVDLVEHYSMTQPAQKMEFEKYKSAYITFKKQYDDIQTMETEYIAKMKSSELEIANIEIQLGEMKEARISTYAKIKTRISQRLKEQLVMKFKESNLQKPSMYIISAISKEEEVPIDDIELWLEWIEKSYLYVSRQEEYAQLVQKHTFHTQQYEHMMKNYILQKPLVEYQ